VTDVPEFTEENDARLRVALIAGSEQALAEVYDTYGSIVYVVALHITRDYGAGCA
jgi:RNA polymerase sigma-70 factor (ECF subfamily)